jgi:hypothetical protein
MIVGGLPLDKKRIYQDNEEINWSVNKENKDDLEISSTGYGFESIPNKLNKKNNRLKQ